MDAGHDLALGPSEALDAAEGAEPSPYDGWTTAEVYVDLARAVIGAEFAPERGLTRWDVRTWWRDEAEHRKACRLTKAQEAELMDCCRSACEPLAEGQKDASEWPEAKPTAPSRHRVRRTVV